MNFWARLLIFAFSVLALIGIKFPDTPENMAYEITNMLSSAGIVAVIGILAVSVIMPIYNFARTKPNVRLSDVFGSPNFWIYVLSFLFGIAVLFGINIPEVTSEKLVTAIYAKDWTGLIVIAVTNILDPVIRWFRDKKNKNGEGGS
jgi:uncharacterized membrane protein